MQRMARLRAGSTVKIVVYERMADGSKMDAYLVRASGEKTNLEQRAAAVDCQNLIGCFGVFAARVVIALGGGMLLLFSGRSIKNPVMRLGKGLSALYNITGYLSDILSYVRIFALGLVSGAMGMVFNLIGGMVYDALGGLGIIGIVIGFILAAALLIALHMFSLFINTLGAFAHTARLQFIEFFGKFYEADGVKFKPLAMNTDTVNVIDSGAE